MSEFLLIILLAFWMFPKIILHSYLLSLFSFRRWSSAERMGITSPYFDLLQRQTEQISYFEDLQYIDRGSWCYLQAIVDDIDWICSSASSGLPREDRWMLGLLFSRTLGEYSLFIFESLSFILVLLSFGSWETVREGERNDLFLGWFPKQSEHLCEYLLDLTQLKQILWPQVALSRL
jgi:hypothetical protein